MCGFCGTVDRPLDENALELLRHRGPDDSGFVRLSVGTHHIEFGHRRLAIVDLSDAAKQPMPANGGRFWIAYNGEVYNHSDLRTTLSGITFLGHSDTETILHYLARHGISGVSAFNGIFAAVYIDVEMGKLFLVRDPFGVKPLYYHHTSQGLIFSSEIKPILSIVRESVDRRSLAETLRLRYCPAPDTMFTNIRKVRPGHIVEFDLTHHELRAREFPFSRIPAGRATDMSFSVAREEYGRLLDEAVERQLMSDVEVGVLLSGGVDSALIAAYAQRHAPYKMKAFTVGYQNPDETDETADAKETADSLGLEYHEVRIGFPELLETLDGCVGIVEEPLATTSIIPMLYLADLASHHVKVVLSGQGADETLGGYGRYQVEFYRRFVSPAIATKLSAMSSWLGVRNDQVLRGLDALRHSGEVDRFLSVYSVFTPEQIQELTGEREWRSEQRITAAIDLAGSTTSLESVAKMMTLDLRMNLSDDLLLYTDKITMHHSLECRVPMLDLSIVKFLEALPVKYRVRIGRGKIIHKALAADVLTDRIVRRKKRGFKSPTRIWFKDPRTLRDILLDRSSCFATYFDLNAVNRVIEAHQRGFNRERQLFLLLSMHSWLGHYG